MSDGGVVEPSVIQRRRRRAGAVASAALVLIAVLLALQGGGADGEEGPSTGVGPRLVDASELEELEGALGHEIYWAGERAPAAMQLTREADGNLYLRYLPPGADPGDSPARFLTVGTYPVADAVGALRRTAEDADVGLGRTAGGAAVLVNPAAVGSVYLAYPGADLQIEVYSPEPGRALKLARSGAIEPVG